MGFIFSVQGIRIIYSAGPETVDLRLLIDARTGVTPCFEVWTIAPGRTTHNVAELARVF